MLKLCALLALLLLCASATPSSFWYCGAPEPQYYPAPSGFSLHQVTITTRHGDRTSSHLFPLLGYPAPNWVCELTEVLSLVTDPTYSMAVDTVLDRSSTFAPAYWSSNCSSGQLTLLGAQQHLKMGAALRSIYVTQQQFLSQTLNPAEVYYRSDNEQRVVQSTEANLLGMYPLSTRDVNGPVTKLVMWPADIETIDPNYELCPAINVVTDARMNTSEWKEKAEEYSALTNFLIDVTGTSSSATWLWYWFDPYGAMFCHDMTIPCKTPSGPCVNNSVLWELFNASTWFYNYIQSGEDVLRLSIGPLVVDQMNMLSAYLEGRTTQKYTFYGAHDSTILFLLNAFAFNDYDDPDAKLWLWPAYASHLIMETLQQNSNSSNYGVRWQHNGKILSSPYFCSSLYESGSAPHHRETLAAGLCPLEALQAYVREYLTVNFPSDCQASSYPRNRQQ